MNEHAFEFQMERMCKFFNRKANLELISEFGEKLSHYPDQAVVGAVNDIIDDGIRFPTISQMRTAIIRRLPDGGQQFKDADLSPADLAFNALAFPLLTARLRNQLTAQQFIKEMKIAAENTGQKHKINWTLMADPRGENPGPLTDAIPSVAQDCYENDDELPF